MPNTNKIEAIFNDAKQKVVEQAFIPKSIRKKFKVEVNTLKATIEVKGS